MKQITNSNKPIGIVLDPKYPNMYRLQWKDGVLSEDMYNLTRSNDILRNYKQYRLDMNRTFPAGRRSPVDAL